MKKFIGLSDPTLLARLPGMRKQDPRSTSGSSVQLCPETNTISIVGGPISPGALLMAQAMCAPNDVLAIVSILDRPENYVIGYVSKKHVMSFLSDQERLAIEKRWRVALTVYDGPEMVVSGTFHGDQAASNDAN